MTGSPQDILRALLMSDAAAGLHADELDAIKQAIRDMDRLELILEKKRTRQRQQYLKADREKRSYLHARRDFKLRTKRRTGLSEVAAEALAELAYPRSGVPA